MLFQKCAWNFCRNHKMLLKICDLLDYDFFQCFTDWRNSGKNKDFSEFHGGVFEKVVLLQAEINRGTVRRRPKFGDDLSSEPACRFLFLCLYRCYASVHLRYTCEMTSSRTFSSSLLFPIGIRIGLLSCAFMVLCC